MFGLYTLYMVLVCSSPGMGNDCDIFTLVVSEFSG